MVYYNKKIVQIIKKPFFIFEIDNFFDLDFYSDIKKIFPKVLPDELSLSDNFGKKVINQSEISNLDKNHKETFEKLNRVFLSKDFFNLFIKKIYLPNVKSQKNIFRKLKYLRYPILDYNKKFLLDFLLSKISVNYQFSYIKNNGGIIPHVDAQRKYLSLLLYFPDDENKETNYGTTFWESNIQNFSNTHIHDKEKIREFYSKSKKLYKTPFKPNCLYGFLRNDFSWHTVEPVNIDQNYIRKSININFIYNN
tara:strand:- start:866 stop:1618 length:753 start_codon:yes stop_codon:yes gene_type:complete